MQTRPMSWVQHTFPHLPSASRSQALLSLVYPTLPSSPARCSCHLSLTKEATEAQNVCGLCEAMWAVRGQAELWTRAWGFLCTSHPSSERTAGPKSFSISQSAAAFFCSVPGREVVPKIKTEDINTLCKANEPCSLFMLSGWQVLDGGKLKHSRRQRLCE